MHLSDDVPNPQPDGGKLYQLVYRGGGQLVIQVSWVSEPQLWSYLASPSRLWARGKDSLFQKLTAEENLFQELEINAVPSHGLQTLDIFEVTVRRQRTPVGEDWKWLLSARQGRNIEQNLAGEIGGQLQHRRTEEPQGREGHQHLGQEN